MKNVIKATLAAGMLFSAGAYAQTTGAAPSTAPGTAGGSATGSTLSSPTTGMGMGSTGTTTPGATPGLGANSQAAPPRSDSTAPAAVTTTSEPSRTTGAPVPGANSFTEGQARSRIEDRGFGNVTDLKKDDQGVWRATAMKDGRSMSVSLDYQGNVVGQ